MRKSAQLSVRITEQEMANLRELATRESVLLSQLIRGILAANISRRASQPYFDGSRPQGLRPCPGRNIRGPDPALLSGANSVARPSSATPSLPLISLWGNGDIVFRSERLNKFLRSLRRHRRHVPISPAIDSCAGPSPCRHLLWKEPSMPSHPFAGRGAKNGDGDGGCRGGDDGWVADIRPASVAPTDSGHLAKGSRQHHERIVVIEAA